MQRWLLTLWIKLILFGRLAMEFVPVLVALLGIAALIAAVVAVVKVLNQWGL